MGTRQDSIRKQFSQNATDYRDEVVFSEGEDLQHLVASVPFTGQERVLDIGSGAGHAALAFAPFVAECIGCDLTPEMVKVATQFAKDKEIRNVHFRVGDVENLEFGNESFDFVTCRYAAHHFSDLQQAIQEVTRVLKPGGTFILVDPYAPEDDALDSFVNEIECMRDSSHVRDYRLSEYESWFQRAGLTYHEEFKWYVLLQFDNWIQRARTPVDMTKKLVTCLQTASSLSKETFRIRLDDTGNPISLCLNCSLLHGVKI